MRDLTGYRVGAGLDSSMRNIVGGMKNALLVDMRKIRWLAFVLAISALTAGCNKSVENRKDSTPAHPEYNYPYDKRDVYIEDANADLAAMDQTIAELTAKSAVARDTIKGDAQNKIHELRNQRVVLETKLEALKQAKAADWNGVKADYMKSLDEVKRSFQAAQQWFAGKT